MKWNYTDYLVTVAPAKEWYMRQQVSSQFLKVNYLGLYGPILHKGKNAVYSKSEYTLG